jgi:hypothetical protein
VGPCLFPAETGWCALVLFLPGASPRQENIPPHLASMDRSTPLQQQQQQQAVPSRAAAAARSSTLSSGTSGVSALADRANVFDGDEFDVFHSDSVRLEGIHVKSRGEGRGQLQGLDDEEADEIRKSTARLLKLQQVCACCCWSVVCSGRGGERKGVLDVCRFGLCADFQS